VVNRPRGHGSIAPMAAWGAEFPFHRGTQGFPTVGAWTIPELAAATGDEHDLLRPTGTAASASSMRSRARSSPAPRISPRIIRMQVCDEAEGRTYILEAMTDGPSLRSAWTGRHVIFRFAGPPSAAQRRLTPGRSAGTTATRCCPGNGVDSRSTRCGRKVDHLRALASRSRTKSCGSSDAPRIRDRRIFHRGRQGYPRMPEGTGLLPGAAGYAVERYGTGADKVAAYLEAGPDMPLDCHPGLHPPGDRRIMASESSGWSTERSDP